MFEDKLFQIIVFSRYMQEVVVINTLGWSGVLNTPKILWYLVNYGIQND
jgi:hypothetical protein